MRREGGGRCVQYPHLTEAKVEVSRKGRTMSRKGGGVARGERALLPVREGSIDDQISIHYGNEMGAAMRWP
jgi:hypothetical protein